LRLLLIRHAQTVWNAAGRVQGQADPPLSELGHPQCGALSERVAPCRFDAIHASDLERARLTAEAVRQSAGGSIALVTHIRVIRLVLSLAAGLESMGLRWPWAIDNTGLSTLVGPPDVSAWDTPAMRVLAVNDSTHLARLVHTR